MICMGMSDDGSGLNLVLAYETQQQPVRISTPTQVELATDHDINAEIEIKATKFNIETGLETPLEMETCK